MSTPRTTSTRSWRSSATARSWRSCAPTPTTTTCGWRRRCASATGAPILLHPDDRPLWELTHPDELWDADLADGQEIEVGGTDAAGCCTRPGHAPGAVCFYAPTLGCVFTGDTLFQGGPGATGRSSQRRRPDRRLDPGPLFALPDETVVHTGHGDDTTIGAERGNL